MFDDMLYFVMAAPPFATGGLMYTNMLVSAAATAVTVGAPGVVTANILLLAALADPVPTALVAVTVKVYICDNVSPATVTGDVAPVPVKLPGVDVTVYLVIAALPSDAGAVNATDAAPASRVAVPIVGAPGSVTATLLLAALATPVPIGLVAFTVNVYACANVNPVIVTGDDRPVAVILPGLDVTK
jgi:hypothetical protein